MMEQFISNSRNQYLWLMGCFMLSIWMLFGCFPLVNIEGDSALYSAGCERLYQLGFSFPPDYMYEWDMQPLIGVIIVLLRHVLPMACEQIYCLLTIIASYAFLFLISKFIERLTEVKWYKAFCLLFLLPETYSIAFYPNTAIFAAVVAFLAFYILMNKPLHIGGLLLLGIAPLFRVDILMIYPIVLSLLWISYPFKKALCYSALYAVVTVVLLILGCCLLKANPLNTFCSLSALGAHNAALINGFESFAKIHISYYPIIALLFIAIGVFTLCKQRNWKLLGVILLPICITYYIYFPFRGSATKHLLYILPLWGICIITALPTIIGWIKDKNIWLIGVMSLCLLQFVVSLSFVPQSQPWISKEYARQKPYPTTAICEIDIKGNKFSFGLGAGQVIQTADELMLATGHVVAPWMWKYEKENIRQAKAEVYSLLSKFSNNDTIRFITTQASDWQFSQLVHGLGYEMQEQNDICTFIHAQLPYLLVASRVNIERTLESFEAAYNSIAHPAYFYYHWDWQEYYVNEGLTSAKQIGNQLAIIY